MSTVTTDSLTENAAHWESMRTRVLDALQANFDDALEVGCMEHGGYDHLAYAVMLAVRDQPYDAESVQAEWDRH